MQGVWGRYALIDLSGRVVEDYDIPEMWYKKHLGGRGIGSRILIEEVVRKRSQIEPLGEDNIIIFGTGPMQGTAAPGAGKHFVMGWSPKTGTANESYAGGYWGHELSHTGYDGIIVTGKSEEPVYIYIEGERIQILTAKDLWGSTPADCEQLLKQRHGNLTRVAAIGRAGEALVNFACIMNDRCRAAGRPGFGAVMGSKRLKAIAVRGTMARSYSDEQDLKEAIRQFSAITRANPALKALGKHGTAASVLALNSLGELPTQNFQKGTFVGAGDITGEKLTSSLLVGRETCAGCPVRCKRVVETEIFGERVLPDYGGPEYETTAAFGSLCLIDDLKSIALASQKCNQYGLDTISTGALIAHLMEATERGFISTSDGISWGDGRKACEIIDLIAERRGLGEFLARGLSNVAAELGTSSFAVAIKGVEVPMHDPRAKKGLAISYATSPRGATHLEAMHDDMFEGPPKPTPEIGLVDPIERFSWDNKAFACKSYEDLYSFVDSCIVCGFISWNQSASKDYYPFGSIRRIINAVTGLEIDAEQMQLIGERNYVIRKIISAYSGYRITDDCLPERLKCPLKDAGPSEGEMITDEALQSAIDEYYQLRGFDAYGPTDAKLRDLDLQELAGLIERSIQ